MADNRSIADDFNETARGFIDREVSSQLLLTKYGLMFKFQAQTLDDKSELAGILCDTALKALEARALPNFRGYLGSSDQESIASVLKILESPESAPLMPAGAPQALAEIGMKFVARAENEREYNDRNKFTEYARLCLDHAERFQNLLDRRNEDVSLAKNITPAKRIMLKKDGP